MKTRLINVLVKSLIQCQSISLRNQRWVELNSEQKIIPNFKLLMGRKVKRYTFAFSNNTKSNIHVDI